MTSTLSQQSRPPSRQRSLILCLVDMTRIKKIMLIATACTLIVVAAAAVFTQFGRTSYSSVAAPYPEAWLEVKPGMISDDVRRLIGEPWADNRELKILDRWLIQRNGVELHLDAWIESPNLASSRVERVVRWKRFTGTEFDRHVEPPWPNGAKMNQ